jgi:hypothetical protein
MTPQLDVSINFLEKFHPGLPWALTAIRPDKKDIQGRTFLPGDDQRSDTKNWLKAFVEGYNIYFHVNPVVGSVAKKVRRENIAQLAWLHVDIDPRPGEELEEEKERALHLLTDKLPPDIPPPTVIVFSGGGYQGFWRLADPLKLDGTEAEFERAKLWNKQLEIVFGGDNCHNIDRIMRLPGTINWPDAKKQKKGRKPSLATLHEFNDNSYNLDLFKQAKEVQVAASGQGGGAWGDRPAAKVEVTGNVARVQSLDELDEWNVPDRVKIIIAQGRHPDEPKEGDNSRSAWVFDAVCNLVRCGVPDDVIFSIMTDPDWGIAESILETGSAAARYATRQIARAKEAAVNPWLTVMNDKFAVIGNIGGKCRVAEELFNERLGRHELKYQTLADLVARYESKRVEIGRDEQNKPITMEVGKWWRKHPQRRQYETVTFAPGKKVAENVYNMWQGFAVDARPGDLHQSYLDHIRDNICSGNEDYYAYLLGWMARTVQQPDRPGEVAIVLRGGRGTGKSFFSNHFRRLFGRHGMQVSNSGHLVGNFNSHLEDLVLLFADEAFFAGDKKHQSILKTLVTEETLAIEAKGVDVRMTSNCIHLIMASNDEHVIPAGDDERRFFVLEVGENQKQNPSYFRKIVDDLRNGGYENLLYFLQNYDISDYEVRSVPETEALRTQKRLSMGPYEDWWYNRLMSGDLEENGEGWPEVIACRDFRQLFLDHQKEYRAWTPRSLETWLGRNISKYLPGSHERTTVLVNEPVQLDNGSVVHKKKRLTAYRIPPLDECRAHWESLHGETDWPEPQRELQYKQHKATNMDDIPF